MLSVRSITARLLNKVRTARGKSWEGFRREQLHPGGTLERPASLALQDEYERITGAIAGCDLTAWIAQSRGGIEELAPTWRYELGRTLVADGTIYYRGGYEVIQAGVARSFIWGEPVRLEEALLASYDLTEAFFGHWLIDGAMMLVLAEQLGMTALTPWTTMMATSEHRADYTALLGSPSVAPKLAIVDRLSFVDDRSNNAGRADRLRAVRARYRRNVTGLGGRRVFIRRGQSGVSRNLVNEDAICDLLGTQYGFTVVDPLVISAAAIVEALANAELVMGVEGSHMAHAVVSAADGALLFMIMPPDRFSIALKWYPEMIGMHFGFTVADQQGDAFFLPPDRLHAVMDLIQHNI